MFPFDIEDEDIEVEEEKESVYKEYEIDYKTGQLTGRTVEGLEAVKVWIYLALRTERYHYEQYSWDYGEELSTLVGTSNHGEYLQMEAKRMVKDCLSVNEHILDIDNFKCTIKDEKMYLSFTVVTDYGEVEIDV